MRGAATLARNLAEMRPQSLLYRQLATLRTDVGLEEELEDLEWHGPSSDFAAMCERLGAAELPGRLAGHR